MNGCKLLLTLGLFLFYNSGYRAQSRHKIDSINRLDYTYISNNLRSCEVLFEKNRIAAKKINYDLGVADAMDKLGLTHSLLGNYDQAVKTYIEAVHIYERYDEYDKIATTYASIGFRIKYIDYEKALHYFRLAIAVAEKHKIGGSISAIYNNYGELLNKEKPDSSLYYFKKSLKITYIYNDTIGTPFSLNNMVVEYARRRDFKNAFECMDLSDKYRFKTRDIFGIADNLAYRGDIFYEIPKVDSAIYYYRKSLRLAKKRDYNSLIRYCLSHLADLHEKKGDYQNAFTYFKEFKAMEDSTLNGTVKSQLATLQVEFETEKTQRALAEEKARVAKEEEINSKNLLKLESGKKWIFFIVALLIVLLVVLFFVYRYQKAKRIGELKEMDLSKQLEATQMEKEFADEKIRIARELHDNIGSHLTFMISSLDNLSYLKNATQKLEKINDLSNFGRLTMKDLRDTIWAMNHDGGSFEQLIARISELRSVLPANLDVQIQSNVEQLKALNGLQLLNCYRIVQEFIQNTIKYANANEIKINVCDDDAQFVLTLSDNGSGFDLSKIDFGNGIYNMKRRCEDLKGNFSIESSDKGTQVTCEIPFV